ncbi:MAG: FAD/NAD(P)-binding oxidoreductase [Candidatus Saccharimonadales bacterium]
MGQEDTKNKHIVIIGAGTTGILLANRLQKSGHYITIIDPSVEHYYQPGFLFVPFGGYRIEQLHKPLAGLLRKGIKHVQGVVASIQPAKKGLTLESGEVVSYDVLVIATGTRIDPTMTEGLLGDDWRKDIHDYYTPDGADALRQALEKFQGGNLVVQIMEMPIKCPVAPLEFTFLADDYFKRRKMREKVKLTYVTPLPGAFTKPVAAAKLSHMLSDRSVEVVTDFFTEKVDQTAKKVVCYDGREVPYDLLVCVPMNVGAKFLQGSELVNDVGFVKVNHRSLQSTNYPHIFAIGDAADVPTSKAGSVGHFEAHTLQRNIDHFLAGRPVEETFDGHSNCFVECGGGKALLLDFNYDTQPYEGTFPFAGIGPMKLLNPSRLNHWGKLAFRWVYWHMLLPGRRIPFIPEQMSLKGKNIPADTRVSESHETRDMSQDVPAQSQVKPPEANEPSQVEQPQVSSVPNEQPNQLNQPKEGGRE